MSRPQVDAPAFPPPYPVEAARFRPGQPVQVRQTDGPGHLRTPWYVRGRAGVVERLCGAFANPEELAHRRSGLPAVPLYRVRFALDALWADADATGDSVDVEIFEHWLEPDDAA